MRIRGVPVSSVRRLADIRPPADSATYTPDPNRATERQVTALSGAGDSCAEA
jgi:hypothetical protein